MTTCMRISCSGPSLPCNGATSSVLTQNKLRKGSISHAGLMASITHPTRLGRTPLTTSSWVLSNCPRKTITSLTSWNHCLIMMWPKSIQTWRLKISSLTQAKSSLFGHPQLIGKCWLPKAIAIRCTYGHQINIKLTRMRPSPTLLTWSSIRPSPSARTTP